MKRLSFVACAMSVLALVSCGGASSEDAKEKALDSVKVFAVDMATKVSKNQKDSVVMAYADAAKADSLALTFVADSVKVSEIDSVTFTADFGNGKIIGVKKDAQGKLTVTESKGLFAYPDKDLDFAKKTGMWADSLTDAQFAERMATKEEFRKYLLNTFKTPQSLVIKKGEYSDNSNTFSVAADFVSTQKLIVTNVSNSTIKGSEYRIYVRFKNPDGGYSESYKGKDLAPGASTTYNATTGMYHHLANYNIIYTTNKAQQFEENFQPKGDEYQKFLDSKKK